MTTQSPSYLDKLGDRIARTTDLPVMPAALDRLRVLLANPKAGAAEIAGEIELNPALAANVLRLANSAALMASQPAVSVKEAVVRVGFREIARYADELVLARSFQNVDTRLDFHEFWAHSIATARTAAMLTQFVDRNLAIDPDTAHLAGLLHDIGILILDHVAGKTYEQLLQVSRETGRTYVEVEQLVLKTDHGDIAALYLSEWKMAPAIVSAIRFHHRPAEAPDEFRPLAQILHLAEFVCTSLGIGCSGETRVNHASELVWQGLGIDADKISEIIHAAGEIAERAHDAAGAIG